jgi:hypothetical protein
VPDWISFWEHAIEKGWKPSGTQIRLETAILEVYGTEYLEQWKVRMARFLSGLRPPPERVEEGK